MFDSGKRSPDKAADLNRLHAKIGQLTLENDFHMALFVKPARVKVVVP